MTLRQILLRVMLIALGAAALAGVSGVLMASGDALWRVTGTAICTAFAAGLLLPVSLLIDRPNMRAAGLCGMGVLIAVWVLINAIIWAEAFLSSWRYSECLGMGLGATLAFGLAATIALSFLSLPSCRTAAILHAVAMAVVLALAYFGSVLGFDSSSDGWKFYAASWVIAGVMTVIAFGAVNISMDRRNVLRGVLTVCALAGGTIAVLGIFRSSGEDLWARVMVICFAIAGGGAFTNLCLMGQLKEGQRWLRWATIVAGLACALCVSGYALTWSGNVYRVPDAISEMLGRGTMATSILAGCGALALIVLSRINRRVDATAETFMAEKVTLLCPRCQKKQDVPLGDSACTGCGLRISLRVEEPRCPTCGYLLYQLTSDRCPECGTQVTAAPAPAV